VKTDEEFEVEKNVTVHTGKAKIKEEFEKKEKNLEVQQRM
jgi:hypothetical protein